MKILNLELLGREVRREPSCLAEGRQVLRDGFGTVVLKAIHIAWLAVLSTTCLEKDFIPCVDT